MYDLSLARIDQHHSNVIAHCPPDVDWPDEALWARLRLHEQRLPQVRPRKLETELTLWVPMPGVARIRLTPPSSNRMTRTQKEINP